MNKSKFESQIDSTYKTLQFVAEANPIQSLLNTLKNARRNTQQQQPQVPQQPQQQPNSQYINELTKNYLNFYKIRPPKFVDYIAPNNKVLRVRLIGLPGKVTKSGVIPEGVVQLSGKTTGVFATPIIRNGTFTIGPNIGQSYKEFEKIYRQRRKGVQGDIRRDEPQPSNFGNMLKQGLDVLDRTAPSYRAY